jgi:ABC-type bacteriocin/lantibiotic exporter with double-glycine peptidase domain
VRYRYSCGAQVAFTVLRYYGKARSIRNVTKELGTTTDGTTSGQLRRLFERRGLRPVVLKKPTLKSLKKEIDAGHPLIVSMDTDHWAVVYGYGRKAVFVADSALPRALRCRHSTKRFRARWDKWAMAIRV